MTRNPTPKVLSTFLRHRVKVHSAAICADLRPIQFKRIASGEILVFMDGDGQHNPEDIEILDNYPEPVMSNFTTHNGETIGQLILRTHCLKSQDKASNPLFLQPWNSGVSSRTGQRIPGFHQFRSRRTQSTHQNRPAQL